MCNCNNTTTTTTLCQEPIECTCKVFLSTDCITLSEDLPCSGILKGQTETEVLKQLSEYICTKFDSIPNLFEIINAGTTGARVYKGDNMLGKKELRRLVDSNLINIVEGINDITISVDETALNTFIEANQKTYSAINIGTGAQVYKDTTVVGDNTQLNLRKIKTENSGTGATILKTQVENTNDISITAKTITSSDSSVTITSSTDTINLSVPSGTVTDGSETKINNGITTVKSGLGTTVSPYVIETVNLQKVITTNYTLTDTDNEYTVFINNNTTTITISLGTITVSNFCVGFIQEGTADVTFTGVTNPTGLKSKGQGYQTFIERKLNTSTFYLLGNTKA